MSQNLIEARNIGLKFDLRQVLAHVDLAVAAGQIVTVIGPNGAGKSSLIKVLLGLLPPSSGSVWRSPMLRLGYVPQRFSQITPLPLTVTRLMTLTMNAEANDIKTRLDETGAGHLLEANVADLSGGELQRVLLARALLRNPSLLILDEPAQSVDFNGEIKLYELIAKLRREHNLGILMVSHDLHIVMAESDRVICLNGHICCQGKPSILKDDPAFQTMFGLRGESQIAGYSHHHDHDHEGHHHHD